MYENRFDHPGPRTYTERDDCQEPQESRPMKGLGMTSLRSGILSGRVRLAVVLILGATLPARRAEGQSYTVLEEFEAPTSYRAGLILGLDGRLYGTSFFGGPTGVGTVFSMDTDGDNYTVLHAFTGSRQDRHPSAPLIQTPDGSLYG